MRPAAKINELIASFTALRTATRAFWVCNFVYMLDGAGYFGILNVLTLYLGGTLHLSDQLKHPAVSFLTGILTASNTILGGLVDRYGVRKTLVGTIFVTLVGRVLLGAAPFLPAPQLMAWLALFLLGTAGGVLIPACYAGVKQSTTAETATIGFSLLYALMNGGSLMETYASPFIRDHFRSWQLPTGESLEYAGVIWVTAGVTLFYFVGQWLFYPREGGAAADPGLAAEGPYRASAGSPPEEPVTSKRSALLDPRFQFFIFILLPVRTLFAHQWLTMPDYMTRAFPAEVGARFEWILMINPLIILLGTPLFAAMTRKVHVVTMMIYGTIISAAATFVLVPGPTLWALIAFQVVFSVGEAMWSSRFYEFVADIAPPNKVGMYMGISQIPWFLAKATTGLYSGILLQRFCPPPPGAQNTGTLWAIYALIGLISPLGLLFARRWLKAGTLGQRP